MKDIDKSKNQLISEYLELKRIEAFLRSEVQELWTHIKKIESLPFFKAWVFFASKLTFFKKDFIQKKENRGENPLSDPTVKYDSCDYLFIYSSDLQEIGGLKTSGKLAKDLIKLKSWSIKGFALQHNPTQLNQDKFFLNKSTLNELSTIEVVVACGSDTIEKAFEISRKYQAKLVLLMMGLDHIFAPTWQESKNFLNAIKESDLVICLAPHLAKQAKIYGAKNVALAPLGFDKREFNFSGAQKKDKVLVSCRGSVEKGLKVVLPSLELLKVEGWKVVGFGDLPDHQSAEVFDEFLGRLNPEELNSEFQEAKFLIDPSWIEGLGLVALEAAACGVIPIITERGDYADLFEKNQKPFLELRNFIDPACLIDLIKNPQNQLPPQEIIKRVSHLSWDKGLLQAAEALENL